MKDASETMNGFITLLDALPTNMTLDTHVGDYASTGFEMLGVISNKSAIVGRVFAYKEDFDEKKYVNLI